MFGVHIPEVQLGTDELHAALALAALEHGEQFVDLGCGRGETLVVAAQEFGAVVRGVEVLPDVAQAARERLASAGVDGAIEVVDMATADIGGSDVVLLHLSPAFYDLLADRLYAQLDQWARVVTARWPVPGWKVLGTVVAGDTTFFLHQPVAPQFALGLARDADGIDRELPAGSVVTDHLVVRSHAPLRAVDCVWSGDIAGVLESETGSLDMQRGQATAVDIRWDLRDVAAGTRLTGMLTLTGDDPQGASVMVAPIPVAVTVTGD